jgi:hypothetical protein
MKIRTAFSNIEDLPAERVQALCNMNRLSLIGYNTQFVPVGTELVVYGIEMLDGNLFYRIGDQPDERHTIMCLAALAEITDGRVSRYWECRHTSAGFMIGPPSWMVSCFHDRLADGELTIVSEFELVKQLMKEEAESL